MRIWDIDLAPESVAADVSDLRLAAGLSKSALAERLGISTTAVSNWEKGIARPTQGHILKGLRELAAEIGYA